MSSVPVPRVHCTCHVNYCLCVRTVMLLVSTKVVTWVVHVVDCSPPKHGIAEIEDIFILSLPGMKSCLSPCVVELMAGELISTRLAAKFGDDPHIHITDSSVGPCSPTIYNSFPHETYGIVAAIVEARPSSK